ncbi:MAG: hypothetical protein SOI46_07150 [Eggerthellaceae bacterium]|jgi:hypothetical protein
MAKKTKDTDDEYAQFLDEISKSIDELDRPYRESRHTRARREARAKRASAEAGANAATDASAGSDAAADGAARGSRWRRRARRQAAAGDAEAEGDRGADAAEAAAGEPARSRIGRRRRDGETAGQAPSLPRRMGTAIVRHPFIVALIVILIAIALVVGGFFWNRSLRYDDAADFQGMWYIEGTTTAVGVTGDSIQLTSDVAYHYTLNTQDKLIDFSFGNMSGAGRYWFSDDRTKLVIIDGTGYTGSKTLQEDIARAFATLACKIEGKAYVLPSGEGVTVLDRNPYVAQGATADESSADQEETANPSESASAASSSAGAAASSSAASVSGSAGSGSASGAASSSSAASASESLSQAGSFDNPSDTPYSSSSAKSAGGQASAGATGRG